MQYVLLSGGSGKRLWPLSNDARSKQFLKILEDQGGTHESMIQRVYRQLTEVHSDAEIVITTNKKQVEIIQCQLGKTIQIVMESERRDTFPAIALAAVYLYSEKEVNLDEVVSVLPVDPFVQNDFFQKMAELEEVVINAKPNLALLGVIPKHPSTKYGYIIPIQENEQTPYLTVSYFKEKPTKELAETLMTQNAFWNCGVFAFKLAYIIEMIRDLGLPLQYEELVRQYHRLPKTSFDYQVVENANKIVVLPYHGEWKDLGTWNTLTEEMGTSQIGKGIISEDCKNTHLIKELDIPVAILGTTNIVVAASPDGILVTEKSASPRLKELISNFNQMPMYEENSWGTSIILDHTTNDNGLEVITKKISINANQQLSYQLPDQCSEIWTIINGEGEVMLNNEKQHVQAGDIINIPIGTKLVIKSIKDLNIIEVQSGRK